MAKWQYYNDGLDSVAVDWMISQALAEIGARKTASSRKKALPAAITSNMGSSSVLCIPSARMLTKQTPARTNGIMLCFDDFRVWFFLSSSLANHTSAYGGRTTGKLYA